MHLDAIFYPCLTYIFVEGLCVNHYNCPVVAYYPEVLAGNCPELEGQKFIYDYVGIHRPKDFVHKMAKDVLPKYFGGISEKEVQEAANAAYAEYEAHMAQIRVKGSEIIDEARRQGRRSIEQAFRNALSLRSEPEIYRADHGTLDNAALWRVGRCEFPLLFEKIVRQDESSVVVELLIDASGSQSVLQGMVALQSYLFSSALSGIGIPHRVMSYCTYGNHTVLRRFRNYDDHPEADQRILEYRATSNNRDGLALAAAGLDIKKRREEHKVAIVFSDGLPNDMISGRKRSGMPERYVGDAAIRDTCFQVRKLRREGVHVLGIFLGEDGELENERMIYGASFLRIRRAEDFAGSAGRKLSELLLSL